MRTPTLSTVGKDVLTNSQATKLASLTGHAIDDLKGKQLDKLPDLLGRNFDFSLLFKRRVCGRVVKKDPITGEELPVPFATVQVEDTDCSFISYFPKGSKYVWHLPWKCKREVIATTKTDKCGNFCVWIPRFEIDFILRFRKKRRCFTDIFIRPDISDILKGLEGIPIPGIPNPPDPAPFDALNDGMIRRRLQDLLDPDAISNLVASHSVAIGAPMGPMDKAFDRRAFLSDAPPPMTESFRKLHLEPKAGLPQEFPEDVRKLVASGKLQLDPRKFIGPFIRCIDVLTPELVPVLDVPDITFKVTQDVDGDGDEEIIYGEGFFDVRWDATNIPDVTLYASSIAKAAPSCKLPPIPSCSTGGILFAGLMSLDATGANPYMNADGYAVRPNRPHPSGLLSEVPVTSLPPANTPMAGTLQLYGCTDVPNAKFYRITYQYAENVGGAFSGSAIMSFPLYVYEKDAGGNYIPVTIYPDLNGWIPIGTVAAARFPDRLLMNWPTSGHGVYRLQLEFANASKNPISTSIPPVSMVIDNRVPNLGFTTLEWRVDNSPGVSGAWQPLELICSVVHRPKGSAIEFRVTYESSGQHFRSVSITGTGCGGAGKPIHDPASGSSGYWHRTVGDSAVTKAEVFKVSAASLQGAYGFSLTGVSRAFNPAGFDNGQASGFNYEPVHVYTTRFLPIAIVDL